MEQDKEQRVKPVHSATEAMSDAVAAQKCPGSSGSPNSQCYFFATPNSEEEKKAKECALRFLTYRQRSSKELFDKLKLKGYKDITIEAVLQHLKELNLINDEAFARFWAKERTSRKPIGRNLLSQELHQKGIATEIIAEVCESVFTERSEESLAFAVAHSKLKNSQNLDPLTSSRRLYSYLRRRGFSTDIISTVMEKILEDEC